MKNRNIWLAATVVLMTGVWSACNRSNVHGDRFPSAAYGDNGYGSFEENYEGFGTESEAAGRTLWYKATAGNSRFHDYVLPQRIAGAKINYWMFFNAAERYKRFDNWGLINDPECCVPGEDCKRKFNIDVNPVDTYGFDWCKGDEVLLNFVGREELNGKTWAKHMDPACSHKDPGGRGNKENPCSLEFGTSVGAIGFRKFPNPRFDRDKWLKLNGAQNSWEAYNQRLDDFSIEPPFLVGISCASCHVSFNPLNLPKNPNDPTWKNVKGDLGNQYLRISEFFASGFPSSALEWQLYRHARPGTTDTSAVPNDFVNNPGTINAIINFDKRPTFSHQVKTWRPVSSCGRTSSADCWCEPGKSGKCWKNSTQTESVPHVLKGGEDSIGPAGAVQRVYINIGSCSEQCWVNHLTDLRALEPQNRNYGQTPFDIGQCRRDCPQFRAIEDRLGDLKDFLFSRRPTDLADAMVNSSQAGTLKDERGQLIQVSDYTDFVTWLEKHYGASIDEGEKVFRQECARCHSSQVGNKADFIQHQASEFETVNFFDTDNKDVRIDWLGNEKSSPISQIKSFSCRTAHSNHMKGHVWEEYASETYRKREPQGANLDGGRGYYRNISLLSLWAHAPLLHNNAVGPEICPKDSRYPFYRPRTASGEVVDCWNFDPSVLGRFKLFEASMKELLTPTANRTLKETLTDKDILFPLGVVLYDERSAQSKAMNLKILKGTNVNLIGNFQLKEFAADLINGLKSRDMKTFLTGKYGASVAGQMTQSMELAKAAVKAAIKNRSAEIVLSPSHLRSFAAVYANCSEQYDNVGHDFGTQLSERQKKALMAFLATL